MDNITFDNLRTYGRNSKYDAACKRILSDKMILARILKECVSEYKDVDEKTIAEKCIEGDINPESVGVNPDESYSPVIKGNNTEDKLYYEGMVKYDILFDSFVPESNETIKLIINLEIQNQSNLGYPLIKRAHYYTGRLLSSQYGKEFKGSEYDKLKKVYSIWICGPEHRELRSTITRYCFKEENVLGCFKEKKINYDMVNIVFVGLERPEEIRENNIVGLLTTLLSDSILPEDKIERMKEDYGMSPDDNTKRGLSDMGSWSQGIYDRGVREGKAEGIAEGEARGVEKGKLEGRFEMIKKFIQKGNTLENALDMFDITDKNEIEFLKNSLEA